MVISFEGPDMVGKSTQIELLENKLIDIGFKVKVLHFPRYDSPIGSLIEKFLHSDVAIDFKALQMLYVADQTDFQEELIKLEGAGYIVLLDRYDLSTVAYYIAKTKIDTNIGYDTIRSWQNFIVKPSLTFIFNAKRPLNGRDVETFDNLEKDKDINANINVVYDKLRSIINDRKIITIDATRSIQDISEFISNYTLLFLEEVLVND